LYVNAFAPGIDIHDTKESATAPLDAAVPDYQGASSAFGGYFIPFFAGARAHADFGALNTYASIMNCCLAFGGASWQDQFTITGAPNGTLLDFDVTIAVDGDVTRLPNSFRQYAVLRSWVTGLPSPSTCLAPADPISLCNLGVYDSAEADGKVTVGSYTQTVRVQLVAGHVYDITHSLTSHTAMDAFYFFPEAITAGAFATADFSRGATFTLTPVTPGAGYTTASGHRYDGPTTNTAPTANAGTDQTVRPGSTVSLDGTGSYDDNTATNHLQFAWSFNSVPSGSGTTLTNANTATPSFVPDQAGTYLIQLVVTDEEGLSSAPAQVTIGENPPPSANAGPDQLVIVNNVVALNGVGADSDGDTLTYAWALTGTPSDSAASLASPNLPDTTFVPDQPGVYVAQLTVSDVVGPGAPDSVRITAITAAGYAEMQMQNASTQILGLPAGAVTNRGNQNAMTQFLSNAILALHDGSLTTARQQLEQAISRTDGCALRGTPDGNGPGRDWITTCGGQNAVYHSLLDALSVIPQ
jgi:hypothetical protein